MPIYQQIPIRLQASLVSTPPVAPIDLNTGLPPQFWVANDVSLAVGIFDAYGQAVDLTNLVSLNLVIQDAQDSVIPLLSEQILAVNIVKTITAAGWQSGTQQQAVFNLTSAQTDLGLGGANSKDFWLSLVGITSGGANLIYLAGPITGLNPGVRFPLPPYGYVSEHAQTLTSGNITVSPTSLDHCEFITVNGSARTSYVIADVNGMTDGAILEIAWTVGGGAPAGIVCQVLNANLSGAQLGAFVTGSGDNGLFRYRFTQGNASWNLISTHVPAK